MTFLATVHPEYTILLKCPKGPGPAKASLDLIQTNKAPVSVHFRRKASIHSLEAILTPFSACTVSAITMMYSRLCSQGIHPAIIFMYNSR